MKMSLADNTTFELWRSFMPRRKEVKNNLTSEFFSMQVYDISFDFKEINLNAVFEKWAAIEVTDFNNVPDGMETTILPGGLYAVFQHTGDAGTGPTIFRYIFETWLPGSEYMLDHRPHFELLGDKYKHDNPDSEEEIWIPVKPKK